MAYNSLSRSTCLHEYAGSDNEKKHVCAVGKNASGLSVAAAELFCTSHRHSGRRGDKNSHAQQTWEAGRQLLPRYGTCSLKGIGR